MAVRTMVCPAPLPQAHEHCIACCAKERALLPLALGGEAQQLHHQRAT